MDFKPQIAFWESHGFNAVDDGDTFLHISCDCCAALVINRMPTHERGCPNEMHECKGCDTLLRRGVIWCEDCR